MKKEWVMFLFFPVSQFLIVMGHYQTRIPFSVLGYAGIVLGVVTDVLLFYVLVHGMKKEKLEQELEEVQYLRETERIYNETAQERQENLVKMQQEFGERLKQISEKIEANERDDARQDIQELQQKLDASRMNKYCYNPVINAVLSEKRAVCEKLGFRLDVNLLIPEKMIVEPIHVCSIFSNLLDNAIEAVEELEVQERYIEVGAEAKGAYLFVKVKNPAKKEHALRKKREGHGYGTQILESIAKRYEGEYRTSYGKDEVYAAVLMLKAFI